MAIEKPIRAKGDLKLQVQQLEEWQDELIRQFNISAVEIAEMDEMDKILCRNCENIDKQAIRISEIESNERTLKSWYEDVEELIDNLIERVDDNEMAIVEVKKLADENDRAIRLEMAVTNRETPVLTALVGKVQRLTEKMKHYAYGTKDEYTMQPHEPASCDPNADRSCVCSDCKGSGILFANDPPTGFGCETCNGSGKVPKINEEFDNIEKPNINSSDVMQQEIYGKPHTPEGSWMCQNCGWDWRDGDGLVYCKTGVFYCTNCGKGAVKWILKIPKSEKEHITRCFDEFEIVHAKDVAEINRLMEKLIFAEREVANLKAENEKLDKCVVTHKTATSKLLENEIPMIKCVYNWVKHKAYELNDERKKKLLAVVRMAQNEYTEQKQEIECLKAKLK